MTTKILGLLFLIGVLFYETHGQASDSVIRIEFTSLTRGYQKQVTITPDSIIRTVESRQDTEPSYKRALGKKDWKTLQHCLGKTKLTEIPELPSPTMKRAHDGALHSTLTFVTKEGRSFTHSFDDENPNVKLSELMKAISEIEKKDR